MGSGEGLHRTNARCRNDDELPRLDCANIVRTNHVERNGLRREDRRAVEFAHDQRTDAERIATGDHALSGHANQGIGSLNLLQSIDEFVQQCSIGTRSDEVDENFRIAGRLENRAAPHKLAADCDCVRHVAVVRNRESARRKVGVERLHVAQRGLTCRRIANMPTRHRTRKATDYIVAVEIARNVPHGAVGVELPSIPRAYPGRFLTAMLQCMKSERDKCCRGFRAPHAKNTALFAKFVIVIWVCRQQGSCPLSASNAEHIGMRGRAVSFL